MPVSSGKYGQIHSFADFEKSHNLVKSHRANSTITHASRISTLPPCRSNYCPSRCGLEAVSLLLLFDLQRQIPHLHDATIWQQAYTQCYCCLCCVSWPLYMGQGDRSRLSFRKIRSARGDISHPHWSNPYVLLLICFVILIIACTSRRAAIKANQ